MIFTQLNFRILKFLKLIFLLLSELYLHQLIVGLIIITLPIGKVERFNFKYNPFLILSLLFCKLIFGL